MQKMTRTPAKTFNYYDPGNKAFTAADLELFKAYARESGKGFYTITNWNGEKIPVLCSSRRDYSIGKLGKNAFTVNTNNLNGDTLKSEIWVF